ncbi:hypothetical protein [Microcoleus phage My-WqHQDG]|nr:hypothetical protein [Microcoleus phage My-WqHQDG]
MELTREHLEVEVSGPVLNQFQLGINEGDFKLAMDILMDLYTDPIGSVVRELASNARDAMNAAGKHDLPIEVTLPTPLSPYLIIKDRGNGMTSEFLTHTYCKLLSSTKRDDNDNIGGYGIGSKSPLGYTDTYTLSTRVDGIELHVHVSRNGGFTTLGSNHTTEGNGTTVTVPVKSKDCGAFAGAISWLRYMDPPPLVNGTPGLKEEVLLEGDNWFIADGDTPYDSYPCILLGPIPYRLDMGQLGTIHPMTRCVGEAKYMRIKFPIGSLTVTPSRESLRYDEHTITTIRDTLQSIWAPAMDAIDNLLKGCEWEVDARTLSYRYSFNGWWKHGGMSDKYHDVTNLPASEKWQCYSCDNYKQAVTCEAVRYYPTDGAEVYLHDKPSRCRQRINAYVKSKPYKFKLLVGPADSSVVGRNLFPTQLLSALPDVDPEIEYKSTTAKPKKLLDKLDRGSMRARLWTASHISKDKVLLYNYTVDTTMPLDGEGYYLPMSAGKVMHPDLVVNFNASHVRYMLDILGIPDQPLYVVPPQGVTRLGPGWTDLVTATNEHVSPWLSWVKQMYMAPPPPISMHGITENQYEEYGIGGPLLEYLKLVNEANRFINPKVGAYWYKVLEVYRYHLKDIWDAIPVAPITALGELRNLISKRYPLLDAYSNITPAIMKHYVSIIDANHDPGNAIMDSKELMIHYYQEYGDVRGYYEQYGQQ